MSNILSYGLLIFNGLTITTVGWLYIAYFKNLNASLKAKDEQLKVAEKNLLFWKDKANDLEKKTPEYMEEVLAKRIKHREEEIKRLDIDKMESLKLLESKSKALAWNDPKILDTFETVQMVDNDLIKEQERKVFHGKSNKV